jgi:hypothetical protein
MLQIEKKKCFTELGKFLSQFSFEQNSKNEAVLHNDLTSLNSASPIGFYDSFVDLIHLSQSHNGWFTPEQVYHSLQSWAKALQEDNINQWLSNYDFSKVQPKTSRKYSVGWFSRFSFGVDFRT